MSQQPIPSPLSLLMGGSLLLGVSCAPQEPAGFISYNNPPSVSLFSPSDGESFDEGQPISFIGRIADDGPLSTVQLIWKSDIDGQLADPYLADASGTAKLVTAQLSPGLHVISLQVIDSEAASDSDELVVTVSDLQDTPSLDIIRPTGQESAVEDRTIELIAQVSDLQDTPEHLLVWVESTLDGALCATLADSTGEARCSTLLSSGDHSLRFTVEDPDGNQAKADVPLRVYASGDIDQDGDGFSENQGDCDDNDPTIHPLATELPNAIDDNCDGRVDEGTLNYDDDGDGFSEAEGDCDDTRPEVYRLAVEILDQIDNNCDGRVDENTDAYDDDGDGFTERAGDCDDADRWVYPTATETLNQRDDNCNGVIDENTVGSDDDGDGLSEIQGDCDDTDPNTAPGKPEIIDGADNNCNGVVDENTAIYDDDGDGFTEIDGDCDDNQSRVFPGATEVENGLDDDCDGRIDNNTRVFDDDGDGQTENQGDCDDTDSSVYLGAIEFYDGKDNDCNNLIDDGTDFIDDDGDGYSEREGDCNDAAPLIHPNATEWLDQIDNNCDGRIDEGTRAFDDDDDGFTENQGDCDDTNPNIHPGAFEVLDQVDNNCDGRVDEGTRVFDDDGDGFSEDQGDCNDLNPAIAPSAAEICDDTIDQNCDGLRDELNAIGCTQWFEDADGDRFGLDSSRRCYCAGGDGLFTAKTGGDCDDSSVAVYPSHPEVCDNLDNNCDGQIDETSNKSWYLDADLDGYGDSRVSVFQCASPLDYVHSNGDCDDANPARFPTAPEVCNGVDDNCSGAIDDADPALDPRSGTSWYPDVDLDGYGDPSGLMLSCVAPLDYLNVAGDCDDLDAARSPLASEIWYDGVDQNCDQADDYDQDGDGYQSDLYGGLDLNDTDPSCWTQCPDGSSPANAGLSCAALLQTMNKTADQLYWLNPEQDGNPNNTFEAYCDMSHGGFTLIMRAINDNFSYTDPVWTSDLLHDASNLDRQVGPSRSKYPAFNRVPFYTIRTTNPADPTIGFEETFSSQKLSAKSLFSGASVQLGTYVDYWNTLMVPYSQEWFCTTYRAYGFNQRYLAYTTDPVTGAETPIWLNGDARCGWNGGARWGQRVNGHHAGLGGYQGQGWGAFSTNGTFGAQLQINQLLWVK